MKSIITLICYIALSTMSNASNHHIIVEKAKRILKVYDGTELIHKFRIGLGFSPAGDKEKLGDGKTPEGTFYICIKNPQSRFYLSLGLNYPNIEDAKRGFKDGLITKSVYRKIVRASKHKSTPPWHTKLGGEIFIHGRGASSDWTLGCIALEDKDMKTLYDLIKVRTKVVIKP